jgi:hypothetical protein
VIAAERDAAGPSSGGCRAALGRLAEAAVRSAKRPTLLLLLAGVDRRRDEPRIVGTSMTRRSAAAVCCALS